MGLALQNHGLMKALLPRRLKRRLGVLHERFRHRPSTYVVSYPKSGRTWLELMTAYVRASLAGRPLEDVLNRHEDFSNSHSDNPVPVVRFGHGYRYKYFCQAGAFPRWFYRGGKIVLLVRDPRDVLVSYYYYQRYQFKSFEQTLSDFVHANSGRHSPEDHRSRCGVSPIVRYNNAWIANEDCFQDILILEYEQLHAEPKTQLRRLLEFADIPADDQLMNDAVEFASFDNMRKMETDRSVSWSALPGGSDVNGFKTRKARVGGFRDELDPHDIEFINRKIDSTLDTRFAAYFSANLCTDFNAGVAG